MIEYFNLHKKQIFAIIIFFVLVFGLVLTVILIQRQQTLKSRAAQTWVNAFEIKDSQGNTILCDSTTTPPTCHTESLDINIKVKDLKSLTE